MNLRLCESIVNGYKNKPGIFHGKEDISCYYVNEDVINLPEYSETEEYYRSLFHELIHSTGHKSRLNRETILPANYFNSSKEYGTIEELTASLGEMVLCHLTEISNYSLKKTIEECFKYQDISQNTLKTAEKYGQEAVFFILNNNKKSYGQSL